MYYRSLLLAMVSAFVVVVSPAHAQPAVDQMFAEAAPPSIEDAPETDAALIGCANFYKPKSSQYATWMPASGLINFWIDAYDPDFPSSLAPVRVYIHNATGTHHIGDFPNGYLNVNVAPGTGLAVFYYQDRDKCNKVVNSSFWYEVFRYQF